jgi:hypothetical protein
MEATIEERLAALEKEVSQLKHHRALTSDNKKPWWEAHLGAFKDSPEYDAAMELAREYRQSQPTAADECDDDVSTRH